MDEREKYERVWGIPAYRSACHSLQLWRTHRRFFPEKFSSALDIGCGLGLLLDQWNRVGIDAWGVDIAGNCLGPDAQVKWGHKFWRGRIQDMVWTRVFDVGVCADVMEHIPPEDVDPTLSAIMIYCRTTIFKIAHVPAHPWLGRDNPLHLTVEPRDWWVSKLEEWGDVTVEVLPSVTRSGFEDSVLRWTP